MAVQYNNRLQGSIVLWGTADTKSKASTFPWAGAGAGGGGSGHK